MNRLAIKKIRRELIKQRLDGLLITSQINIAYLSGFAGEGQLIITPKRKIVLVDFRFKEQADKQVNLFEVRERQNFFPLEADLCNLAKKLKIKRLGFEAPWISYVFYLKLKDALQPVKLIPTFRIIENLRAIKSVQEIKALRKAAAIAVKSFFFARKIIKPGKKEVEIAREVQYFMRKLGAQDCAFETIVAAAERSAMPHAHASEKRIKRNNIILIDLGCRIAGYNSDLTRMVFLGKISAKVKRIYKIIRQAQKLAIEAIKAGVEIGRIDKIARQHIAKSGLDAFFGHALGHGIGREVHEYPSINPHNRDCLKKGMVFTVEPGIYIPGLGGVRVEDMVLVTKSGCEVLTKND